MSRQSFWTLNFVTYIRHTISLQWRFTVFRVAPPHQWHSFLSHNFVTYFLHTFSTAIFVTLAIYSFRVTYPGQCHTLSLRIFITHSPYNDVSRFSSYIPWPASNSFLTHLRHTVLSNIFVTQFRYITVSQFSSFNPWPASHTFIIHLLPTISSHIFVN